ncbi:MAG: cache domain-containing protein, partial [Faecalibacterium sp.]|nr:cache domain-containing protein [Faecalibacterium sp.]
MKKKSVLYTWAAELGLMLVLTVAMCVALTGAARSRLLQEYEQFTALQQEKIETSLDNYFTQLQAQAVELLSDSTVQNFAYLAAPTQPDNYDLYLVQMRLLNAMSTGITDHIYIYFQNIRRAITDETILDPADCTQKLLGGTGQERMKRFHNMIGRVELSRLEVMENGEEVTVLSVSTIPLVGRVPRAAIIQQVSMTRLRAVLESQSSLEQATTLLLNEESRMVCHTGDGRLAEQLAAHHGAGGAANRFEVDGREYWLYHKQLKSTGWTLITAAPMEIIASRTDWVWQMAIVFVAALVLVWVAASATIMHWNYRPLKKLKSRVDFAGNSPGNEYDQIDLALQTAKKDLADLKQLQKKHREVLRMEWLSNAIAYDIPTYSMVAGEFMTEERIDLTQTFWQMLLLGADQPPEAADSLPEQPGCSTAVLSVRGRAVICLFAVGTEELHRFACSVEQILRQNGVEYRIGQVQQGFAGLHEEFLALCEQAERPAPGAEGAVGAFRLSLASSEEIVQLVFAGKGKEACALLTRSAQSNLAGQTVSVHLMRMYYNDFLLQLLNHVPDNAVCAEVQRAIISTARALNGVVTQPDMQELTDTLILAVAAKYQPGPEEAQPELL